MGKNLATKILEAHLVEGKLIPGTEISIKIDHTLLQDATGTMAMLEFMAMGVPTVKVELAAQYIEQYGKMAQVAATLDDALAIANRAVTKEDLICITGSFYLVGEAKKLLASQAAKPL